jgi:hypothetical protein
LSDLLHSNLTFSTSKHWVLLAGFERVAALGSTGSLVTYFSEQDVKIKHKIKNDFNVTFFIL